MAVPIVGDLSFRDRELKAEELDLIRQIARDISNLSLTVLAHTICELLEWRRPNGGLRSAECYDFLQALHRRGWLPGLSLQPKKLRQRSTEWDERSDAQTPLVGLIGKYLPVQLRWLDSADDRAANGTEVGLTQGRGRMDRSGKTHGVRNHIFLFPLHRHWRERLGDPSPALSSSVDSVKECR